MDCQSGYSYHQQDKQILGGCLRTQRINGGSEIYNPISFVPTTSDLRYAINSRLIAGDVAAVERIVISDDSIVKQTPAVFDILRMKHPLSTHDTQTASISRWLHPQYVY